MISDPQRWLEWAHGVAGLVAAVVGFVVTVVWWVLTASCLLSFSYAWAVSQHSGGIIFWFELIGVIALLLLPMVVRGASGAVRGVARVMLTSDRISVLQGQVTDLTESRDAAVSAEATALRRLERDIHDGPQQRLVRLAMDLSTAQRRLDSDPEAAKPLLEEAIQQTRETLDELRALSRGIAPPILVDRGLPSALAALASRCTVHVELDIAIPSGVRLPDKVENAAYFVVAEALTNVAKHSAASQCRVHIEQTATLVRVLVTDDGIGGAHPAKGHGLAGLTDRIRALGGRLEVESPAGGPTIVAAELPCGS